MLMINNNFARFQLPGNFLKQKKCFLFPWQHAIFYLFTTQMIKSKATLNSWIELVKVLNFFEFLLLMDTSRNFL
jgi:hypothetical protein